MFLTSTARFRIFRRRKNTRSTSLSQSTRNDLNCLVHSSDPILRKVCRFLHLRVLKSIDLAAFFFQAFDAEMQAFFKLHSRYLADKDSRQDLCVSVTLACRPTGRRFRRLIRIKLWSYDQLPKTADPGALSKLAILKFNGGLGTSIGMSGAKSAFEVKDGMTFLDLIVQQVEHLNKSQAVDVPLLLMTSFNTHEDTLRVIQKYDDHEIKITTFNQSRYPRIFADTLKPCPNHARDEKKHWYPSGHGDLYDSLVRSGVLDRLLADGKEYLFVSNSDNLGAVVDQKILQHMMNTGADFLIEVTNKTEGDAKRGTLMQYDGSLRLLEIAQVPFEHVDDFKSARKFKIFNTNNLWIDLKALRKVMTGGGMELDIIVNPKVTDDGQSIIQVQSISNAARKLSQICTMNRSWKRQQARQ
ncbi:UTP--glucose-1-phosphate uridylyltransferase-domain-containing protein [Boletus reticuloceps]|uniref:UTP--glucose-1-phosphate uridylyltransferase n=1 Tax=Boletus reticuloceps TaxID=495285 RepID=A0A8I2YVQ7_9AGAM|nr:UTP--glucose-1-phosphate uridylyltransferase-domain-containing protein [Boletus reticuloceps]